MAGSTSTSRAARPRPAHAGRGSRPQRTQRPKRARSWRLRALLVGALVCVVAGGVAAANAALHHRHSPSSTTTTVPAGQSPSTTALPAAAGTAADCPLTGTPAPGGVVPHRSALAFKIDNYPTARPQSGLTKADIVFEEPVEGGVTRFVAVYQCQSAGTVGPVRSARNIDIGILGQLGHPILVHMGGITPVVENIQASPIIDFELGDHTSIIDHVAGRVAPYSTYTSTTAVWHLEPTATTVPQPLFDYSSAVPSGAAVSPATTVSIPFSGYSDVTWRYDASTHRYLRYYGTEAADTANGTQQSAANVVVQFVSVYYGPWIENTQGALEVQANLYTDAGGDTLVFRDGVEVSGHWSRSTLGQPTDFVTTSGTTIELQPGNTWVELVPTSVNVTTSAGS